MKTTALRAIAIGFPLLMLIAMGIYAWTAGAGGIMDFILVALSHFVLFAGAASIVGAFFGLLFAFPHSAGTEDAAISNKRTLLEHTADWLTKLLLGAGLVQMKEIGSWVTAMIGNITQYTADKKTISTLGDPTVFLGAILVFFVIYGFFLAYFLFERHGDVTDR